MTQQGPLGLIVRKAINANSGLKDDRGFNISCFKRFSIANVL